MKLALVIIATLIVAAPSQAAAQTTSQFEAWFALPATVDIGDDVPRVQLWLDTHVRRGPDQTLHILRPGLGLRIYEWMIVYVGYAWVPTFIDSPQSVRNEHRIWEQVILNAAPHPRVAFQSRTRFEQRFSDQSDGVAFRLRQFVRFGWKLAAGSPFGLVLWDEIFLGLSDAVWGPTAGFDQNRLFFGPSVDIPQVGRFEVGYLFNYLRRSPSDVAKHVLYIQLVVAI